MGSLFRGGARHPEVLVLAHSSNADGPVASVIFGSKGSEVEAAWQTFCSTSCVPAIKTVTCAAAAHGLSPLTALHVRVGWKHFREALNQLQPSVSMEDLERYEQLAKEYQNTK